MRGGEWLTRQAYAHRGLHDARAPENSLAAFSAAIAAGLGIECDVRQALDGRAMVFHDDALDRLTGAPGQVSRLPVGELTALRLGASDERIPTLRDTLERVAGQVPLLLELKTARERPVGSLCRSVARDIAGYRGAIAVMSFDPRVARWFVRDQPDLPRGLVMTENGARTLSGAVRRRLALRAARPDFLAYDVNDLPSALAERELRRGRSLLSWTVRTPAQLDAALAAGATPILEGAGVAAWQSRA